MTMHAYAKNRAYLITETRMVYYTTDKGISWNTFTAPSDPNKLGIPLLDFHPLHGDWLIWTGSENCNNMESNSCKAIAHYTKDNGRHWYKIDDYVRICTWGRDKKLRIDEKVIFCEAYRDKKGSQRAVLANNNPLRLISGDYFYGTKTVLFENIVGFATFEEYMVVAEVSIVGQGCSTEANFRVATTNRCTRRLARLVSKCRSMARRLHSLASLPTCISRIRYVSRPTVR